MVGSGIGASPRSQVVEFGIDGMGCVGNPR